MTDYVLKNWRLMKVATTKAQKKLFFNLRKMTNSLETLPEQAVADVAEALNVDESDVREMALRMRGADTSFDAQSEDDLTAPERVLALEGADPAEVVAATELEEHQGERLQIAFEALDARSQEIIRARWMSDDKSSLATLAESFGVSIERVRQIEQAALKKLRRLASRE